MAHHAEHYGFECACDSCTSLPDRCRAFTCPKKGCPGPVCPCGTGKDLAGWKCLVCSKGLTAKERQERERAEEEHDSNSTMQLLQKVANLAHLRSVSLPCLDAPSVTLESRCNVHKRHALRLKRYCDGNRCDVRGAGLICGVPGEHG